VLTQEQLKTLRRSRPRARNRLQVAMELAKVTQVQVAEGTGHTQSYISRIKNGQYSDLPGDTLHGFAEYFGCHIEDLFPRAEAVA
jgi:transcriptional regulator with XRE-family HTH domain